MFFDIEQGESGGGGGEGGVDRHNQRERGRQTDRQTDRQRQKEEGRNLFSYGQLARAVISGRLYQAS